MSSNTPTSPGNGDPVEDKNRPLDKVRHNSATLVTRPVLFIHSLGGDSQPGRQVRNAHTLSYGDMVNIAYGLFVPAIKQDLAVHGTKSVAHILFPSLRHDSSQSDISMEILEVAMWYALGLARMSESGRHALRHS
ncbi:predicted protein [Chaetomium globosum CBS 148.51]|uniref:Uncharacterized protein n=1 Tax=Chaetomium globosum (strain ATCC 6205 / CBS 148.51 / DSM 1962 / NBRC 6347 / NRRL 1970) TaxID=306901 RepID=Q2H8N2_CHAGB|nr:uncharacterized protein CHGG_03422 [Chaetomium globosum CBS 148.51]EAQ91487.1 predicted protein [Chaetomium globosum CBS 148.51]